MLKKKEVQIEHAIQDFGSFPVQQHHSIFVSFGELLNVDYVVRLLKWMFDQSIS
jgi:hypothetical protein